MDVVKTRIQLDPAKYNQGFIAGFKQISEAEGAGALLTGLMPTAQGYFIQGWFKFGGVEFFKIHITKRIGDQTAWDNRNVIYLASSGMAEFIADIFLCPYEACRIRLVSNPDYASGMAACASRMVAENGFVKAFYSGFVPILFKQIPYTMAKFAVQGQTAEKIYSSLGTDAKSMSKGANLGVSLGSGVVAGARAAPSCVAQRSQPPSPSGRSCTPRPSHTPRPNHSAAEARPAAAVPAARRPAARRSAPQPSPSADSGVVAAIISHPADSLLSKINKAGAGGSGSMMSRLANIASETGKALCRRALQKCAVASARGGRPCRVVPGGQWRLPHLGPWRCARNRSRGLAADSSATAWPAPQASSSCARRASPLAAL